MAGIKISNLPAIATPAGTDVFALVQAGVTYKCTLTQLSTFNGSVNTGTINQLAYYAAAGNTLSGVGTTNSATWVTNSTGVPVMTGTMTNGQLIIGSTGATPTAAALTAGTGISITNGAGSIALAVTGGGFAWSVITGTSQAAAINNGYFANNAGLVTVTLPATAVVGDTIRVAGMGAGGWLIAQNAGQSVRIGALTSTVGVGGSLASTDIGDAVEIICRVANTGFQVISSIGNITVV